MNDHPHTPNRGGAPPGSRNAAKPPEDVATAKVQLRVTPRQKNRWVRAAQTQGGLSQWAKTILDHHADLDLGDDPDHP